MSSVRCIYSRTMIQTHPSSFTSGPLAPLYAFLLVLPKNSISDSLPQKTSRTVAGINTDFEHRFVRGLRSKLQTMTMKLLKCSSTRSPHRQKMPHHPLLPKCRTVSSPPSGVPDRTRQRRFQMLLLIPATRKRIPLRRVPCTVSLVESWLQTGMTTPMRCSVGGANFGRTSNVTLG